MTGGDLVEVVVQALGGAAFIGLIIFFLKDRRRVVLENKILEGTQKHRVDLSSISAVEAHVAFVEKAFDAERESKDRQIKALEQRLVESEALAARQRDELERVQAELQRLKSEVDRLNRELQVTLERLEAAMTTEGDE